MCYQPESIRTYGWWFSGKEIDKEDFDKETLLRRVIEWTASNRMNCAFIHFLNQNVLDVLDSRK